MVTEYNRYTILQRKMKMAEEADKAKSVISPLDTVEEKAEVKENLTTAETPAEESPKKTDAEKLKRGRKKNG